MARPKKEGTKIQVKLATNINELLEKYCEDTGATKTKAVEKAIEFYVNTYYDGRKDKK